MSVGDAAVEASDEGNRPRIRNSRGVARAVSGDHAGAIADFEAFIARPANVSGVPLREAWVARLESDDNPVHPRRAGPDDPTVAHEGIPGIEVESVVLTNVSKIHQ
jgi:hypothetical protein